LAGTAARYASREVIVVRREPVPRCWTIIGIVVAVVIIAGVGAGGGGAAAGVTALAIAVLVGVAVRALYFRTRRP
jgi:hypothetical protein